MDWCVPGRLVCSVLFGVGWCPLGVRCVVRSVVRGLYIVCPTALKRTEGLMMKQTLPPVGSLLGGPCCFIINPLPGCAGCSAVFWALFVCVPDGKGQLLPSFAARGARMKREGAPLSLHPYLADATAGEDTSVQWRTAASPSARPPPECARTRSPLSAGLSPLRLEKHSVLQLGERRPYSAAGPCRRLLRPHGRTALGPSAARIRSPLALVHRSQPFAPREALGAAAG